MRWNLVYPSRRTMANNFKVFLLLSALVITVVVNVRINNARKLQRQGAHGTNDDAAGDSSASNGHRIRTVYDRRINGQYLEHVDQQRGRKMKASPRRAMFHEDDVQDSTKFKSNQMSPYVDPKLYVNSTGENKNKLKILMWNAPNWMKNNWYADVDFNQCAYNNCKMIHSRWRLEESHAVMFSLGEIAVGFEPPVSASLRNPDQAWIFYTLEPPNYLVLGDFNSPEWQNAFNWSWTYRVDSDIFHPYGILQTRRTRPQKNYSEIFRRKSKMVAWAVSHCSTEAKREDYVTMMQRDVSVDIFGSCGSPYPDNFMHLLDNDYKFYLGFENSFCPDYITEKFFQYYKNDLIVVVRGGGSYAKYLPKGSYINADDFPTVKALTDYLQKLAADEEEYIKYLKVKDQYDVIESWYLFRDALCNVCDKLNNLESNRKTYRNIVDWFGDCITLDDLH